ncbi:MAG: hypothetical protein IGS38_23270 [Synechococcales cyanobacterium M58_A2018_015]|nr:hypothetical protein [Synechococcales cyanobacterium M58_A2018_015]
MASTQIMVTLSSRQAGLGSTRLLRFQVQDEVEQQRLQLLLQLLLPQQLPPGLPVQAVFAHQRHLWARIRVFLEFLTAHCAKVLV